jgi:hypothetical protein
MRNRLRRPCNTGCAGKAAQSLYSSKLTFLNMRNPNPIPNPVAEILQRNTVLAEKNAAGRENREQMHPYATCVDAARQNGVVPANNVVLVSCG